MSRALQALAAPGLPTLSSSGRRDTVTRLPKRQSRRAPVRGDVRVPPRPTGRDASSPSKQNAVTSDCPVILTLCRLVYADGAVPREDSPEGVPSPTPKRRGADGPGDFPRNDRYNVHPGKTRGEIAVRRRFSCVASPARAPPRGRGESAARILRRRRTWQTPSPVPSTSPPAARGRGRLRQGSSPPPRRRRVAGRSRHRHRPPFCRRAS